MMIINIVLIASTFGVPGHPSDIAYPSYSFTPPTAEGYRYELSSGIPVYIVEDQELPLINITMTFRGGAYLDPEDQVGLSSMMAGLVRRGGTTSITAEDVDERFDFLAASASVGGSGESVVALLGSLSSNFEEGFGLFLDMLRNPGFQQSRIDLDKDTRIEGLKQRNDHPNSILGREARSLIYGDSYMGRSATASMVESVTADDLRSMHSRIINPTNLIIALSGDFDKNEMLQTLEDALGSWEFGESVQAPPNVRSAHQPGIYYVDQDVPQGGVRIGLRSLRQGDPDFEAATVMNYILGGGGFSSRITQRVRSDEGLAYSAGSFFVPGIYTDGLWSAWYESKSKTVALAASLIFDEITRIREELVSDEDMDLAKSALIERFPSTFQSKSRTIGVFVSDELTGRDPSYWSQYKDKIGRVTLEDVQRVANDLLDPEKMAMIVVGDWDVISTGNDRASMQDVLKHMAGSITELPLRDPLTLEPAE